MTDLAPQHEYVCVQKPLLQQLASSILKPVIGMPDSYLHQHTVYIMGAAAYEAATEEAGKATQASQRMQEPAKAAVAEAAKEAVAAGAEGKGTKRLADQDAKAENGPAALKLAPDAKRRKTDSDWGNLKMTPCVRGLVIFTPYHVCMLSVLSHRVCVMCHTAMLDGPSTCLMSPGHKSSALTLPPPVCLPGC